MKLFRFTHWPETDGKTAYKHLYIAAPNILKAVERFCEENGEVQFDLRPADYEFLWVGEK